ncbi:MAG: ABC transporter permease [Treponema sp.]|nr:ABC transporter permease [Treponema sp.]
MSLQKTANFVGFFLFLCAWELFALLNNGVFVPHSLNIFYSLVQIFSSGKIWIALLKTLFIVLLGVFVAIVIGLNTAMAMGISKFIYNTVFPVVNFIRHIPTIALFPTLMALFGVSDFARIVLIALNSFPAIVISAYHGISVVDKSVIEASRVDGASEPRILFSMKLPLAISEILNGIRISIGNAFVAVVVAEMLGASNGLGFMIMWATNAFNYPEVYAYIIILSVLGIVINKVLNFFIKKIEGVVYA